MVAIPPKPPTKTSHTTPTPAPHHLRHRQQPHPLKHPQHRPRRPRNTTRRRNHAQTVVHYTPNTPCHPDFTEVDCTLSNHPGGFATIDPRHADDTPQSSAYGSNSPHRAQASTRAHPNQPKSRTQNLPKHPEATASHPNTQHSQHTRRGATASAVAPLPGSQPETRVT